MPRRRSRSRGRRGETQPKGGPKGGSRSLPAGIKLLTRTPDRKLICFAWNNQGECCKDGRKCNKVHCCQICLAGWDTEAKHPFYVCPKLTGKRQAAADAGGEHHSQGGEGKGL